MRWPTWIWRLAIWWSLRRKVTHQWCGDQRHRSIVLAIKQEGLIRTLEERIVEVEDILSEETFGDLEDRVRILEKTPREISGGLSMLTIKMPPRKEGKP